VQTKKSAEIQADDIGKKTGKMAVKGAKKEERKRVEDESLEECWEPLVSCC